ncbi:ABC transporter permease [Streptomyces sp. DH37]|uniref:ABC transporter permease n=1 Tax=Streptomyces sp. DH37 TaxID=3040122 RepID=UPI00244200DF|nr:ABC transporter permease subunit [Streptomyces sp. DH37]MDG9701192.1 ABC transporter permease subunit [Streptomyces sp. DH37]
MRPETGAHTGAHTGTAVPAPRGEDASIHNIGYRHYDGPRLGRSYARLSLLTQSLRGAYGLGRSAKSKVLPFVLLAVMLLPAGIIVAVAVATGADELPLRYTDYALVMQPVIGLYLASQAPQSVSRDLRFRTVPLYFSRPIERTDYVAAKYLAMSAAMLLFTAAPLVIMYAGALLAKLDFGDETTGFLQGLASVTVLSVLHAGIGLVVAALTPRRGFGVAAIIAVLTIPYFAVTTVQAIADAQGSGGAVPWIGLASPGSLMDGFQSAFLGGVSNFPGQYEPSAAASAVYVLVILGLIAACWAALMARYRKAGL